MALRSKTINVKVVKRRSCFSMNGWLYFAVLLISFSGLSNKLEADNLKTDSILNIWNNDAINDSLRYSALEYLISDELLYLQTDSALYYASEMLVDAEKSGLTAKMAKAKNLVGTAQFVRGDFLKASVSLNEALHFAEQSESHELIADILNNLGNSLIVQGDFASARQFFTRSISAAAENGDELGVAFSYHNVAYTYEEDDPDSARYYYEYALELFKQLNYSEGISSALARQGVMHMRIGDFPNAIDKLIQSLRIDEQTENLYGKSITLVDIGIIYELQGNYSEAERHYMQALEINREINDIPGIWVCLNNLGYIKRYRGNYAEALSDLKESFRLKITGGDLSSALTTLINIAVIFVDMQEADSAAVYLNRSRLLLLETGETETTHSLELIDAKIDYLRGNFLSAERKAARSAELAEKSDNPADLRDAAEIAFLSAKASGNYETALRMHAIWQKTSLLQKSEEGRKAVLRQHFEYEFEKKEALLRIEQERRDAIAKEEFIKRRFERNAFLGGFGVMFFLAMVLLKQRNSVSRERRRSDDLLLNILPAETASELKATGKVKARNFEEVTVLFSDFPLLPELYSTIPSEEIIARLNDCFGQIEEILSRHGVEKIKTIKDAYLAAGGLPATNDTHPADVLRAALEICDRMKIFSDSYGPAFQIRIGINTGPVVAGVVGIKKFQFDIWGDTVNTASRMESAGMLGGVNISQSTYLKVAGHHDFEFVSRGRIEVKGKGEIEMFFVSRKD